MYFSDEVNFQRIVNFFFKVERLGIINVYYTNCCDDNEENKDIISIITEMDYLVFLEHVLCVLACTFLVQWYLSP